MTRHRKVVLAWVLATTLAASSALAGGASDSSGEGSHCYLFFSFPNGRFAQAMVNDSKPAEVIKKTEEFLAKYEGEGGTLELAIGNIAGTVCAPIEVSEPEEPAGCPGGCVCIR